MRTWLLALTAAASLASLFAAGDAAACPPGPCTKYRRPPPPQPELRVEVYRRSTRALPPRFDASPPGRRALTRFLTTATWIPVSVTGGPGLAPPPIRFLTAVSPPAPGVRAVWVRQLEQVDGITYVDIDGTTFTLGACAGDAPRSRTSCLTRIEGGIPEPATEVAPPDDRRFAQPPP